MPSLTEACAVHLANQLCPELEITACHHLAGTRLFRFFYTPGIVVAVAPGAIPPCFSVDAAHWIEAVALVERFSQREPRRTVTFIEDFIYSRIYAEDGWVVPAPPFRINDRPYIDIGTDSPSQLAARYWDRVGNGSPLPTPAPTPPSRAEIDAAADEAKTELELTIARLL